jgi:hypothetical protein
VEKISSIIPSSARVASVDMREAAPVRPGAPGFGRPEGANAGREREKELARNAVAQPTTSQKGDEARQAQMDWRSKEDRGAAIAKSMSDKFFIDRRLDESKVESGAVDGRETLRDPSRVSAMAAAAVESRPTNARGFDARGIDPRGMGTGAIAAGGPLGARANSEAIAAREELDVDREAMMPHPDELYPKGSFINYRA